MPCPVLGWGYSSKPCNIKIKVSLLLSSKYIILELLEKRLTEKRGKGEVK
jgi:hypothetical protein